jgi:hypothetical protein
VTKNSFKLYLRATTFLPRDVRYYLHDRDTFLNSPCTLTRLIIRETVETGNGTTDIIRVTVGDKMFGSHGHTLIILATSAGSVAGGLACKPSAVRGVPETGW